MVVLQDSVNASLTISEVSFHAMIWNHGFNSHLFLFCLSFFFICGCAGFSLLCGLFSSCGERGLLFYCWAQSLGHTGLSSCRSWTLDDASTVVGHRLSCSTTCGISPDQESDPHLLNWQTDFYHWATREPLGLSLFKWLDFKSDEWKHFSLKFIL